MYCIVLSSKYIFAPICILVYRQHGHLENSAKLVGVQPLHVLKDIDLRIDQGEYVSIMSSGSGKSAC